ncbi:MULTISPECIES: 6,7-dimethyl-8-ribityllumazine synthase [Ignavibacterium]|jgi:6,7-dimethyl-8-ribityllumazine synthase|uniref:6,7-dimethyl-8-ribityllumazine synthase n=1 Tax=Ignavibacterium TaxID=795750 RepID=UPI0025BB4BC0|nr:MULTISPECIES: 6,7-dimethyl-8-ribityllumazine synthase [Ignavibacterium]MBI5661242.1 6,7-dimethyl-8-ribityllumazine synthase [Ignavibacterium album]
MKIIEGKYSASGKKFAIILSRFNEYIGENLLKGAIDCFEKHGVTKDNIDVVKVPGAFEIPVTADKLAASKKYSAIVCLGVIIRGATPHFEYVASAAGNGILQVALKHSLPVIFGVLTTDTIEQAIERAGTKAGNKGWDAAQTAIEMSDLFKQI